MLRSAAPAVVAAVLILTPFLGKAFTIDDLTFLLQAEHLFRDPVHPTAFSMVFDGELIRLSDHLVTGPVMAYLLVPAVLSQNPEVVAHTIQLLLLIIGLIATASLALRLGLSGAQAALAALLVAVSPAVLGMASTAMPDTTAMVLGVAGVERLMAWSQTGQWRNGFLAGGLLGLATLARPHLFVLIPLAGCFLFLIPRDATPLGSRAQLASTPVLTALTLVFLVNYLSRDPASGGDIAGTLLTRLKMDRLWTNLANIPLQWTLAFPLAALWVPLQGRRFTRSPRALIGVAVGFAIALLSEHRSFAVIGALGAGVLAHIIDDALRRRDPKVLLLTGWLLMPFLTVWYQHVPAKYLVPSAPAMAILVAALPLEWLDEKRKLLAGTAAFFTLLGVAILRADAALAEVGRMGGMEVARQVKTERKVWLDGGWGYQWYAMKAGAEPLAANGPRAQPGDIVVVGLNSWVLRNQYPNRELVSARILSQPGGRLFGGGAGFYASGPLPWVWGRGEYGRVEVWRIQPTVGQGPE